MAHERLIQCLVIVLHFISLVFDIFSALAYLLIQSPWYKLARSRRLKAKPLVPNDPGSPYRCVENFKKLATFLNPDYTDIDSAFRHAVTVHGPNPCLGTRELLAQEEEIQPNGKVFTKDVLGDYVWLTYDEVNERVSRLSAGLRSLGLKPHDHLCIYAETRAEWLLTALACFRINITVVTLYSTLGEDAVVRGINESEAKYVVTSDKLLYKFKTVLSRLTNVRHIVYMDNGGKNKLANLDGISEAMAVHQLSSVENLGAQLEQSDVAWNISPDDVAVIMYTSGSTASPKGVMLSHRNVLSCGCGQILRCRITNKDVYAGYLPLAHIYEMFSEVLLLTVGARIGYATPNTLTDKSSGIKKGCHGDLYMLRPTLMAIVPVILERIRKSILEDVRSRSVLSRVLFQFAVEYKQRNYRVGYHTPLIDGLVFSKISKMLGGNFRVLMSGGAPLSPDTQLFLSLCLCTPVLQGYGLTETCGAGSAQEVEDFSVGRTGQPLPCNDYMLVDWPEAGYSTHDKPRPRGELWIGGSNVALGYYKDPVRTRDSFHVIDGQRWMATGDIAEFDPDGCIRIIDRKKDLVKLQGGEYIAPAKIETVLKPCPLVDNVYVCARSSEMFAVCFVVPNRARLIELASECYAGLVISHDFNTLCEDEKITDAALKIIQDFCVIGRLVKMEIPQRIHLCPEPWEPESNLITESFKLKRWNLESHYSDIIAKMYAPENPAA